MSSRYRPRPGTPTPNIPGWTFETPYQARRDSDGARVTWDLDEWFITRTSEGHVCRPSIGPFSSVTGACGHADLMKVD